MGHVTREFTDGAAVERNGALQSGLTPEDRLFLRRGFLAGTTIGTEAGWQPVETLSDGDKLFGPDGAVHVLKRVTHRKIRSDNGFPRRFWPLRVPPDFLENAVPMMLLPGQLVQLGQPRTMARVSRLKGLGGIAAHAPGCEISVTLLDFGKPALILANHGAVLGCPAADEDVRPQTDALSVVS